MTPKQGTLVLCVLAVCTIVSCILDFLPDHTVQDEAVLYCQKVHDKSWPDFHHVYRQECKADGSVNWGYVNGN